MIITIHTRADYFEDFAQVVSETKKGDRVALATMIFDSREPIIRRIAAELANAAARGVNVNLAVDARVFLLHERTRAPGPLWFRTGTLPRHLSEPFRSHRAALDHIATSGGNYAIINQPRRPFSLMHAGRSHIKAAVVNNELYVGGCNLEKPDDIDAMLSWHDSAAADWLYKHLQALVETGRAHTAFGDTDQKYHVDTQTDILVDAGTPGKSRILDEALHFIDEAREWIFFTCQFVPHGIVADHLVQAKRRGVSVTILFNHPSKHTTYEGLLQYGAKARERLRLPADYFSDELPKSQRFLHGKLIATEQGAMLGSHNYVSTGVRLGTAEMAVISRNRAFARQLVQFIEQQLHS